MVTRFCYRQVKGYGAFHYKLHQIRQGQHDRFFYPSDNIEKQALTVAGMRKFALFNELYVPQCNSLSLELELASAEGENPHVFSPTSLGKLRLVDTAVTTEPTCEWASIATSDLAFSIMTMMHHLVETNNGFFHVGISLLPAGSIFMPVWLSDDTLEQWLSEWKTHKMRQALDKSIISAKYLSGNTRVQSFFQPPPQAPGAARTMAVPYTSKWLAIE